MTWSLVAQGLVSGVILGALYGLIGCSLTILYGTMRVVNFAHGEFVIAGCYAALVFGGLGVHPLLVVPIAFVLFFGVGMLLYKGLMPRLMKSDDPELASFLSFYGVSLMAGAALLYFFEADTRSLNQSFEPAVVRVLGLILPTAQLVALAVGALLIAGLTFFLYRTLPGKALRAAIMNRDAIQIVGVNIERLSALAFGLAIGLGAVTGVLIAMVFPAFGPFSGLEFTLIGFVVIVLGGLGNPVGAIVGGIVFGVAEQLAIVFMPQSLSPVVGFLILVVTIMFRPAGMFGRTALR
ncbi:MAG: branched-chain amino acid ABC transporter permease [Gammaproteobacteria bacterium]|nr:branched-chain amino acid ABC transporter permease [Gammaproteobacteria bacterium]MBU1442150.1 branched-chain amino acid ABC transporter permease [Gammaproteobacteria bacterium]MBU2289365.1 branched-chain amino acid ABC transporter permease [Gammaproteobacteria bacterium]MBU2410844.1 branched-chain amino acid ABC transporter permease [Gammaproteobacteria bacterium]